MKIIDKIRQAEAEGQTFFSFEYFPPKTPAGVENLYARIERMGELAPSFVDLTWGAGGSTADLTLEISSNVQNLLGLETMMHLTCTNMSKQRVAQVLEQSRKRGINNILALRGDPPRGAGRWQATTDGFQHAIDLVRFIRQEHGDHFGICVAGFPESHDESEDPGQDLRFLREKIEAGADFVITQLFYDCDAFLRFAEQCRNEGIECPVVPGLMPIQNHRSFSQMRQYCRRQPEEIVAALEPIKNNDAAVRDHGVTILSEMCKRLVEAGSPGLHFYTLNLELVVTRILDRLELVPERVEKTLPWRSATQVEREKEDVRPIFWANRPRSYLARTVGWDEYPNGRWGDSRSPAFGNLADYHLNHLQVVPKNRLEMWGQQVHSLEDVYQVFVDFCAGKIKAIPWYDRALEPETQLIRDRLMRLNQAGLLTINSQPRVNGAPSDDPAVGWGNSGGRVFQKAYLEFFVASERLQKLLAHFDDRPELTYHAINRAGDSYSNCEAVNAVTWGVFPGQEILQPTVVDPGSFEVWKDEAFDLWRSVWAQIYEEGSESRRLLQSIHDTFYLVNVVDNDFVGGDLFQTLENILTELEAAESRLEQAQATSAGLPSAGA